MNEKKRFCLGGRVDEGRRVGEEARGGREGGGTSSIIYSTP